RYAAAAGTHSAAVRRQRGSARACRFKPPPPRLDPHVYILSKRHPQSKVVYHRYSMLVPVASVDDGRRWRVKQLRDQARALGWPSLDGGGDLYVPAGAEGFISFITYRVPYAACGQRW